MNFAEYYRKVVEAGSNGWHGVLIFSLTAFLRVTVKRRMLSPSTDQVLNLVQRRSGVFCLPCRRRIILWLTNLLECLRSSFDKLLGFLKSPTRPSKDIFPSRKVWLEIASLCNPGTYLPQHSIHFTIFLPLIAKKKRLKCWLNYFDSPKIWR